MKTNARPLNNRKAVLNISVIIPTLDRPESLKKTISSIFFFDAIPNELIVIDQSDSDVFNSNALFLEDIKKQFFISVIHKQLRIKSLCAARNAGLNLAANEIIVFLDDDILFHNDCLSIINDLFLDPSVALIGGINCSQQLYMPSLFSRLCFGLTKKIKTKGLIAKSMIGFFPKTINGFAETEWAMGFCFAFRKSIATDNKIFFDEKMIGYCYAEDLDYTHRYITAAKKRGLKSYFCNKFVVEHLVAGESRIPNKKTALQFIFNRYYLMKKYNVSSVNYLFYDLANLIYKRRFKNDSSMKRWIGVVSKKTKTIFKKSLDEIDFEKEYNSLMSSNN